MIGGSNGAKGGHHSALQISQQAVVETSGKGVRQWGAIGHHFSGTIGRP
jgi:hypothetical protein